MEHLGRNATKLLYVLMGGACVLPLPPCILIALVAPAYELILYVDCDIVSPIRMSISIPITVAFAELGRSIHHPKPTIALKRTSLHLPPASSPVRLRLPEFRSA